MKRQVRVDHIEDRLPAGMQLQGWGAHILPQVRAAGVKCQDYYFVVDEHLHRAGGELRAQQKIRRWKLITQDFERQFDKARDTQIVT